MTDQWPFEFVGVSKTYSTGPVWARRSVKAVRNASFSVAKGETLALIGESGSGKTTISNLCLGLITPTRGEIRLNGKSLSHDRRSLRGQFSAVLQNPGASLNPRFSIARSILEPEQILSGRSLREGRELVLKMLEKVGLSPDHADRYPHELSGGQRQRVAIARALCTSPRFIVFDEAVSALDVSVQAQVLNLICDLQEELGFSALFITHDLLAARYIGQRVGVMKHGELIEVMSGDELYKLSENDYIRQLQQCSGIS